MKKPKWMIACLMVVGMACGTARTAIACQNEVLAEGLVSRLREAVLQTFPDVEFQAKRLDPPWIAGAFHIEITHILNKSHRLLGFDFLTSGHLGLGFVNLESALPGSGADLLISLGEKLQGLTYLSGPLFVPTAAILQEALKNQSLAQIFMAKELITPYVNVGSDFIVYVFPPANGQRVRVIKTDQWPKTELSEPYQGYRFHFYPNSDFLVGLGSERTRRWKTESGDISPGEGTGGSIGQMTFVLGSRFPFCFLNDDYLPDDWAFLKETMAVLRK